MVTIEGQPTGQPLHLCALKQLFISHHCTLYYPVLYRLHGSGRNQEVVNPIEVLRIIETDFNLAATLPPHLDDSHLRTERSPELRLGGADVWVDRL